jgi:xylan 1,4-beta-xylosidase
MPPSRPSPLAHACLLLVAACAIVAAAAAAQPAPQADPQSAQQPEVLDIDLQAAAHPLPHFWEQAFGSGRAILTLREGYRNDLRAVKAATDFQYARFHAIFHDEVGVYDEDAKGNPIYNFSYVDQIYDGLLANGVRPFVEISFMPKKLAVRQDLHAFWYKQVVAPPKSYVKWDGLITAFARHLVGRYGIDEVAQWYFEVWNEPNIDFWTGNPKQRTYFELYDHTARALKAVDARLRVGGPSSSSAHWVDDFLAHAAQARAPVDFVSSHGYADDTVEDLMGTHEPIPMDQRVCRAIGKVRAQIAASAFPKLPLMWTEWNVPSFGDAVQARDSAYVGAGVAETISQCDGLVDMLAFWTFSDVFEENGPGQRPFTGSFGLMGLDGIMKPSYTAYALLHRLGTERIASPAPGTLATRRAGGQVAIALWNLRDPGTPQLERDLALRLAGLPSGARLQLTVIDDEHGSSRAAYRAMGSPRYPTRAQVADMNRAAALPAAQLLVAGADGRVNIRLAPNALALLEVLP